MFLTANITTLYELICICCFLLGCIIGIMYDIRKRTLELNEDEARLLQEILERNHIPYRKKWKKPQWFEKDQQIKVKLRIGDN